MGVVQYKLRGFIVGEQFELDTRQMLYDFKKDVKEDIALVAFKVDKFHEELATFRVEVTNHLAHRLQPWVTIVITVLGTIIGFLAGQRL